MSKVSQDLLDLESRAVFEEWQRLRTVTKRSLDRASALARELGLSEVLPKLALLGVVGSKGKGTAAIYASAAVAACGLPVGTITSPGVISNRDRVRVNGAVLSDSQYKSMLELIISARARLSTPTKESGYLSPSGLYMLAGLHAIAAVGCAVAVVEAGIGGLSDELSLLPLHGLMVTEIFNEHAEVLGPTVADIAADKIGVVSDRTKFVISLPQSDAVAQVIGRHCQKLGTELATVESNAVMAAGLTLPPGLNRSNALVGIRAGLKLSELISGEHIPSKRLATTINSVNYPGRLSVHPLGHHTIVIDSAISRTGLVTALVYAQKVLGHAPAAVYVSVPANKDYDGFVRELQSVETKKYFVDMPGSHLPFPQRSEWPWDWILLPDLSQQLGNEDALVVGTATFSAAVLQSLGADSARVFKP